MKQDMVITGRSQSDLDTAAMLPMYAKHLSTLLLRQHSCVACAGQSGTVTLGPRYMPFGWSSFYPVIRVIMIVSKAEVLEYPVL
jgi:hypothetical protein